MINIGLKKHLESHNKLSGFCKTFTNSIFPECEIKVTVDETYKFFYNQILPNCELSVFLVMERDLSNGINFGSVKLNVKCYISNKSNTTYFYYEVKPKHLSSQEFISKLNLNPTFKEFHTFYNLMNTWNFLNREFNQFNNICGYEIFKQTILSPYSVQFKKDRFSIIPAIIRYEKNDSPTYLKRYDFCIIISYTKFDFISKEEYEKWDSDIKLEKFKIYSGDKETNRKIIENNYGRYGFEDNRFVIAQSTIENKVGFFNDLENPKTNEVSLSYKIGLEEIIINIDKEEIKKILELWSTFNTLTEHTDFKSDMWKD